MQQQTHTSLYFPPQHLTSIKLHRMALKKANWLFLNNNLVSKITITHTAVTHYTIPNYLNNSVNLCFITQVIYPNIIKYFPVYYCSVNYFFAANFLESINCKR